MPLPLNGVRVVDFTAAAAGPCATMLLGDFGAEVIKVEPPGGEQARKWGTARIGPGGQYSGLYLAVNRNKSGIVADLKRDDHVAQIRKLISTADVVVENFTPGVADRLGVGYSDAKAIKPDIVYCSISGFGQTGPLHDRPGFDNLIQAYVGQMSVTGEPGRPSVRSGISPNDMLAGAHAAFGIMVALVHRMNTGEGQHVETSLYEAGLHFVGHYIADFSATGVELQKTGSHFPYLAPYGIFSGSDRDFYLGCGTDRHFVSLCKVIDRSDLATDDRFATNGGRVANRELLHTELEPILRQKRADYWVQSCIDRGIPTSLLYTIAEVVRDQPQAVARDMLVPVGVDDIVTAGIPIKLSRTPGSIRRNPPALGQDNSRFLQED
jgi:crotonobetainyl-CoA:carnitine CoA-transferase CaiB-like acyl-CoA transferase